MGSNAPINSHWQIVAFIDARMGQPPLMDGEQHGILPEAWLRRMVVDFLSEEASFGSVLTLPKEEAVVVRLREELTKADRLTAMGKVRRWICRESFEARAFGARFADPELSDIGFDGPVRISNGRSILPLMSDTHGAMVPHALYQVAVRISPQEATEAWTEFGRPAGTGFSDLDMAGIELAMQMAPAALPHSPHGAMETQALFTFQHDREGHEMPEKTGFGKVSAHPGKPAPTCFEDYEITVCEAHSRSA